MLRRIFVLCVLLVAAVSAQNAAQRAVRETPRVAAARRATDSALTAAVRAAGVTRATLRLYLRVFKEERVVEVWAQRGDGCVKLRQYRICGTSGEAGPKNEEGDGQIPEGCYTIDLFNPWSSYHLSMRIDYPNAADRARNPRTRRLGGDIYIHGMCVSIGCISISTEEIQELYILCSDARRAGQRGIPVHVFPCRMQGDVYDVLRKNARNDADLLRFWTGLETVYTAFEAEKSVPRVTTTPHGSYTVRTR
ncbi:MAG: L,D-transpeptidase family protein [Ignavibacteriae bacterium]|nr:L,D-transpeptidase family protein [Ignavibacteriota bacterium]